MAVLVAAAEAESTGGGEAVAGTASPLTTDRVPWQRPQDRRRGRWFAKARDHAVPGHIGSGDGAGDGAGEAGEAGGAGAEEVASESERGEDEGEGEGEDGRVGPWSQAMNAIADSLSSRNPGQEGPHRKYQHWTWLVPVVTCLDPWGEEIGCK